MKIQWMNEWMFNMATANKTKYKNMSTINLLVIFIRYIINIVKHLNINTNY